MTEQFNERSDRRKPAAEMRGYCVDCGSVKLPHVCPFKWEGMKL